MLPKMSMQEYYAKVVDGIEQGKIIAINSGDAVRLYLPQQIKSLRPIGRLVDKAEFQRLAELDIAAPWN